MRASPSHQVNCGRCSAWPRADCRYAPPRSLRSTSGMLPGASWHDPHKAAQWLSALDRSRPIVAACKAGHELSQMVAAKLRGAGVDASVLAGGYAGWTEAGLPLVDDDRVAVCAAAPEPLGDAAAAEDRSRRLSLADPPLHRSDARNSCSSIRRRCRRSRVRPAPCRSTSRAWS